jgi:phage terminase large subunit-like protein
MTRGDRVIRFIESVCVIPEGALVGSPMVLAEFQKGFIRAVYDNPAGTRRAYLSIARKNGKTGLIAGILLAHLVGPEAKKNSQIVSGAMSRDQAALVFNLASKMVQLSPKLSGIVRIVPSSKRLIGLPMNVEFRALSAEGKTAHGLSPVLAILDEVGQIDGPQSDFVDAITTSQGAHEAPLLLAISTQAANDADLFSIWLDDAERSKDPRIVSHVYAAPKDAGVMDESGWKAANPALGLFRSLTDLEEQAKQAARMPSAENSFRNLCLNQRVSMFAPFVSRDVWEQNGGVPADLSGRKVWVGLDLSARTDLTSAVILAENPGGFDVVPYFWTPSEGVFDRSARDRQPYDVWVREGVLLTTPGKSIDYESVLTDLTEALGDAKIQAVAFDRWRIDIFKQAMSRLGIDLPLVEFGQGFRDMSPALDALEEALLNGKLSHGMHPVLTMCAANAAVIRDSAGNRKLDKQKITGRIDGMVALAMAIGAMTKTTEPEPERKYQMFVL